MNKNITSYRNIIVTLAFSILLSSNILAQNFVVSGKVTDLDDGKSMPFVSIQIKGSSTGTTTDIDGMYKLSKVKKTDTLIFSFVGYEKKLIPIKGQSIINVQLKSTINKLDEVVVTALSVKRQKKEIGYSTQKVEGEELQKSDASNVLSAISGKSAGVQIGNSDGVDGGTTRITIRGNNNIDGNNQPLIVVDGIPIENEPGMTSTKTGTDWGSAINNINAADIASINILKGGAASALYGSRGANGVILITTKKGRKQDGIGISYNVSYKLTQPYRFRNVQNKYGGGAPISLSEPKLSYDENGNALFPSLTHSDNLILDQDGNISSTTVEFGYYGSGVSWGPEMLGEKILWWDGNVRNWSPQSNNIESVYRNGVTASHNLAFEGGGKFGSMRVSITHRKNTPIIYNSGFDQTTANVNALLKVSKKVTASVIASYIDYNRKNSPTLGESSSSFSKGYIYSWPRSYQNVDFYNYENNDGTRAELDNYPYQYVDRYMWWKYFNNNTTLDRNKFISGINLNYQITDWLSIVGRTGIDFQIDQFEKKHLPTDVAGLLNGYYKNSLRRDNSVNNEFLFTAVNDSILGSKFGIKFNGGASTWQRSVYGINGNSGTWYYPNMYTFSNYTTESEISTGDNLEKVLANEYIWNKKINSVFSFVNLSYSNFLFLEITGRNDWSSSLPIEKNSFFYPSATISFIPSELIKAGDKWLDFLKIRGGVSQTATDTDPYQISFDYASTLFGGNQAVSYPSTIPPIALLPQRVNSYEAGSTIEMLKGKITFDFTYYYVHSFDQIMALPVPTSSGASRIRTNEGVLTNRGIELILHTTPVFTKNLLVKTGLNYAKNRNRVESLGGDADTYEIANIWGLNGPSMILKEGDNFGTIYGYDYIYKDGKPVLNDEGTKYLITDTRVPIGNASPKFIAGWYGEVRYKQISFKALIDCKWGGDIYSGTYVSGLQNGQTPETLLERDGGGLEYTDPDGNISNSGVILPGVHEDGTTNTNVVHYYYKYLPNAGGWGKMISTPGIVDNTWVKMREISVSYTFSNKITRKLKVFQSLTLSLVGRDLFYLYTSLPNKINPEGILGSGDAQGFEWASMPGVRSFSFQLNARF